MDNNALFATGFQYSVYTPEISRKHKITPKGRGVEGDFCNSLGEGK